MRKVRVGLAGCGFAGNIHARSLILVKGSTISKQVKPELVVAVDTEVERAHAAAEQYGWEHAEKNWERLFDYDLDLIIVALPNNEHLPIIKQAVKAGIAVLLEKPMAAEYAEAMEIYRLGNDNPRLRVAYVNRFVPAVQRAKEYINAGHLGKIRMVRSVYLLNMRRPDGSYDWRFDRKQAGHGAIDDLGSHHIDLLQFLAGDITSVQAASRVWSVPGTRSATNDDAVSSLINLENGAFGTLSASRTSPGHPLTGYIEIDGEKGALRIDRAFLNDLFIRDITGTVSQKNVRPDEMFSTMWASPTVQGAHPFSWHDCFAFQMAEMLLIAAGIPLDFSWSATLKDGISAMTVTEAMMYAAQAESLENVNRP